MEKEEGQEKAEQTDEAKPEKPEKKAEKPSAKRIVRLGGKDLNGDLPVSRALAGIRGISYTFANAVSKMCGFGEKPVGDLSEQEKGKIEDMIENPEKHGLPSWTFNRRSDPEDGKDRHMISGKLELRQKMDINELKKRKCYRGIRHIIGLPVRGQRTRSSFRKSATVGVSRVKQRPQTKK